MPFHRAFFDNFSLQRLHGRYIRTDFSATQRAHTPTPGRYMGYAARLSVVLLYSYLLIVVFAFSHASFLFFAN